MTTQAASTTTRSLEHLGRFGLPLIVVGVVALFWALEPATFGTGRNFSVTLDQQMPVLIAALAVTIPLVIGEFDLSVGANVSLANTLVVGLTTRQGLPILLAVVLAILASAVVGVVNGAVVVRFKVNAFVATLATGTIVTGLSLAYMGSLDLFGAPDGLTRAARDTAVLGIPNTIPFAAAVAIVLFVALNFLPVGRRMRAVGGNRRASELTGIPVTRYVVGSFVAGGALSGVAGVMMGMQLGASSASSLGTLLLPAFAAAFLGATAIEPGRFNVPGTVVAVCFLAFTVNGLQLAGVSGWIQPVVNGAALLAAVSLSAWALRLRSARLRSEQLRAIAQSIAGQPASAAAAGATPGVDRALVAPGEQRDGI
jgi:ribose transport system permease protein